MEDLIAGLRNGTSPFAAESGTGKLLGDEEEAFPEERKFPRTLREAIGSH